MHRQKLHRYFVEHADELLRDVSTLVAINSEYMEPEEGMPFGKGAAKCVKAAGEMMEGFGFKVGNYDNYVITADYGPAPRKLDILAHLDVVPAGDGWTVTTPFAAKVCDGRVYGRGTADDKGPALCALYAMRAIKELNIHLKKGVRLILGSDEERGGRDLEYYYSKEKPAPVSFSPDADFPVINVEKGGLKAGFHTQPLVTNGPPKLITLKSGISGNVVPDRASAVVAGIPLVDIHRIAEQFMKQNSAKVTCTSDGDNVHILVEGKTAHSSTPERGENAITAMLAMLDQLPFAASEVSKRIHALHEMFPHSDYYGSALGVDLEDEISGHTTLSLNILEFSDNMFAGAFDCRACLLATNENTRDVIYETLKKHGFVLDSAEKKMYPPHHVPEDSELVQSLLQAYTAITGKVGKPLAIGGGTYVHGIKNGVAFGCSSEDEDNHMHGADEFMSIPAMLESCEIFAQAILNLCG